MDHYISGGGLNLKNNNICIAFIEWKTVVCRIDVEARA